MHINSTYHLYIMYTTSVDVERSFSIYKQILADNRRTLTFEHIKQYIVVQCNHHILSPGKNT